MPAQGLLTLSLDPLIDTFKDKEGRATLLYLHHSFYWVSMLTFGLYALGLVVATYAMMIIFNPRFDECPQARDRLIYDQCYLMAGIPLVFALLRLSVQRAYVLYPLISIFQGHATEAGDWALLMCSTLLGVIWLICLLLLS